MFDLKRLILIVVLHECGISIELTLRERNMFLAGTPTVGTIAISIRNQLGSSLFCSTCYTLGANQVEIAFTLATELQMTLIQNIIN